MYNQFEDPTLVANQTQPYLKLVNSNGDEIKLILDKDQLTLGRDDTWATLLIPQNNPHWNFVSRRQAILIKEGQEYRIYDGDRQKPSSSGIFLDRTRINLSDGCLLKNGTQLQIGQDPQNQATLSYYNPLQTISSGKPSKRSLKFKSIQEWPIELGRTVPITRYASIQLDAPTVSRNHAAIFPDGNNGHILQDLSTNGTFVNGQRIEKNKRVKLKPQDTIQIGPFTLLYKKEALELVNAGNQIRLDVHQLIKEVKDKQGNRKTILDRVSFPIQPGQLVALVGGSGAGKSTLMKALLGVEAVNSGHVFLNGDDLRQNWAIYRSQIGYVPQDDIVHSDLTVKEVLTYACQLRLPPDTDVEQVVNDTLGKIKLTQVRNTLVKNLSGGQRKRVSIGVELLANPRLFFLDEPTSGLDPGLDKEMMQLLRDLANEGRTIILVTHATTNLEFCDRLVFMGRGGRLCYFGPPQQALKFFAMPNNDWKYFSDIYWKTEESEVWQNKYLNSLEYKTYITDELTEGKNTQLLKDISLPKGFSFGRQFWLLSKRYFQLVQRDFLSLILALIAGPITIFLTVLCLHRNELIPKADIAAVEQFSLALRVLFIFCCLAIWIGLSNSVREIVKETAIYLRERLVNLGLLPYLGSKIAIRSLIALGQTLLIVGAILLCFEAPKSELIPWFIGLSITTFLTLIASTSLSLMISAFVKTENEANGILPLIMIPQIIFSTVLFKLEGLASKISWLTISRWSIGAYGTLADVNNFDSAIAKTAENAPLTAVFKPDSMYEYNWENLSLNWGILVLHTFVYLAIAFIWQKRKDIF